MSDPMKRMKPFILATDIGFILYWSFFPLDMVLSTCGLLAVRRHARGEASWRPLAAFSLALTFCAGFMAICFWAIRLDFDPSWWAANLFLTIWPCFFLPWLARSAAAD